MSSQVVLNLPYFDRVFPITYEQDGEVIGAVDVVIRRNARKNTCYALIDDLVVVESHRGKGISRILMDAAIARAKKEKCYKVIANSHRRRKAARGLYLSMGFRSYATEFRLDIDEAK